MRKYYIAALAALALAGCERVPPQHVGIKVSYYGDDKGVDEKSVLGTGSYFTMGGLLSHIIIYPTYSTTEIWKAVGDSDGVDQSLSFNDSQGLRFSADFSVIFNIKRENVIKVYLQYHEDMHELANNLIRTTVVSALNREASTRSSDDLLGKGKTEFLDAVTKDVKDQLSVVGINIEQLNVISELRAPEPIIDGINNKIRATQMAQQRDYEIAQSEAEAKKKEADAEGDAQSILIRAKAQAQANIIVAKSLTPELIQNLMIEKWNGISPQVSGSANNLIGINLKNPSSSSVSGDTYQADREINLNQ